MVFVHELGHGVTALFLCKGKIKMYVGSYKDYTDCLELNLGRLKIILKYNPLQWNTGMCSIVVKTLSTKRRILVVLMGPIASLMLAFIFFNLAFMGERSDFTKALSFFLMIFSLYDFYVNIKPSKSLDKLDRFYSPSDGSQLLELLKLLRMEPHYTQGLQQFSEREYNRAAKTFEELIKAGYHNSHVYRYTIFSYVSLDDYESAYKISEELKKLPILEEQDYFYSANVLLKLRRFSECIEDYSKALELNPDNAITLNNRGYAYNNIGLYKEAINDCDKSLALDPKFSYPYNNRGFARIKLGLESEGLEDIHRAFEMDAKNAYTHRNLGIYHFDKGEYDKALEKFELTYEMDKTVDLINEYLEMTREKLERLI